MKGRLIRAGLLLMSLAHLGVFAPRVEACTCTNKWGAKCEGKCCQTTEQGNCLCWDSCKS
jgi:hypothetical protein